MKLTKMGDLRTIYEFSDFRADTANKTLTKKGENIAVTPKVFDTLIILLENAGNLVEKDFLMEKIWHDRFVEESNITFNIKMLRKALDDNAANPKFIENIPRRGYRFIAEVRIAEEKKKSTENVALQTFEPKPVPEAGDSLPLKNGKIYYAAGLGAILFAVLAGLFFFSRSVAHNSAQSFAQINKNRLTSTGKAFYAIISPDGKYVIHAKNDGENQSLWIRQFNQERDIEIVPPTVGQIVGLSVSPDSQSVYYTLAQENQADKIVYQVPILGGAVKQFISGADSGISFSADGNEFVFYRTNPFQGVSQLVLAKADGTHQKVIAERKFPETFETEFGLPIWKPNERKVLAIAASLAPNSKSDVVEIDLESGAIKPFIETRWKDIQQIAWLKNSASLLLVAYDEESNSQQVFNIDSKTGRYRKVTSDLNDYRGISLSTDEKVLITTQTERLTRLWKTTDKTAVTADEILSETGHTSGDEGLSWTPENGLLFSLGPHLNDNILIFDQNGMRPLTVDLKGNRQPVFCANKIVFAGNFVSSAPNAVRLFSMEKDGTNPQRVTADEGENEMFPHCTAKSDWLVYQRGGEKTTLWKIPVGGGKSVQLTDYQSFQPTISPDGQAVAFYHLSDFKWSLNVVSINDGKLLKQFPIDGKNKFRHLRWTPDGQNLAYSGTRKGVSNIWLQPLKGGEPTKLTDFADETVYYFDWSPDGKNLAFMRGTISTDVFAISDVR